MVFAHNGTQLGNENGQIKEVEAPILWSPDVKTQLIGKDPDDGKDWGQEEKGVAEDEMVKWHRQLNGHEFEQTPGQSDGQGSLMCCSPWVTHDLATEQQEGMDGVDTTIIQEV